MYKEFAEVYDIFMDNVPYKAWGAFLQQFLRSVGINEGIILDLGCGTGAITRELSHAGYDMIGVDNSIEMLEIARDKSSVDDILYLYQDMRELELYGTVKAVVSACDSINYILDEDELRHVFSLINNYLDPEGYFIFDLNTQYKYQTILSENVFAENRSESSFIWDNYYHEEEGINEYNLTIFARAQEGLYQKFEEVHYQKAYSLDRIQYIIEASGMEFMGVYDAYTNEPPKSDSERVHIIARERGKRKKNV